MLGVFTDQAYNLILLGEDEARMLGRAEVEPEHLLLALARSGNVERLLAKRGVRASEIHRAIVEDSGLGVDLVLGEIPRSAAANDALERAIDAAAQRGVLGPSSEHLLLGLRHDERVIEVLHKVGIGDVEQVVDAHYTVVRPPVSADQVKSYILRVGAIRSPPRPGPIPPVFERFTIQARSAVATAERLAAELEHEYVEPFHLLLGLLRSDGSLAAATLRRHGVPANEAMKRAQLHGPGRSYQSTGIFSDSAREVLAKGALKHAYRRGEAAIGTGHVLLATLEADDAVVSRILGAGPLVERIAADVLGELPGNEEQ